MKTKKMNDQDYLAQYVAECKEMAGDLFGDFTDKFIEIKISQFNLASYKKRLKLVAKMEANRLKEEVEVDEFWRDL